MNIKKLLIMATVVISVPLSASFANNVKQICKSDDGIFKLTTYTHSDPTYSRILDSGDHQVFGVNSKIRNGKLTLSNYSTLLIFNSKKVRSHNVVKLITDNSFEKKFELTCINFQLSSVNIYKTKFTRAIKKIATKNQYLGERNLAYRISNLNSFNLSYYRAHLSYTISDIGDWFEIELNKKQENLVKIYLQSSEPELLKTINSLERTKVAGYLFARDWYSGSGVIGVVLKKNNELLIVPVPFDYHTFNDEQLDNVY